MPKIFNLILYNDNVAYNRMRNVLRKYLKTTGIEYYFYCYDKSITSNYVIDGDIIRIRGTESYLPGIILKTIDAIAISLHFGYDYLLRSNASTIINIEQLNKALQNKSVGYACGNVNNLTWLDPCCGIYDDRYKNTKYAQGTAIILSREYAEMLIRNKNDINTTVIDDVSLGLFFNQRGIYPEALGGNNAFLENQQNWNPQTIFYRNRSKSRVQDAINMQKIINGILKVKANNNNRSSHNVSKKYVVITGQSTIYYPYRKKYICNQ
jgi:hypothetical protein